MKRIQHFLLRRFKTRFDPNFLILACCSIVQLPSHDELFGLSNTPPVLFDPNDVAAVLTELAPEVLEGNEWKLGAGRVEKHLPVSIGIKRGKETDI